MDSLWGSCWNSSLENSFSHPTFQTPQVEGTAGFFDDLHKLTSGVPDLLLPFGFTLKYYEHFLLKRKRASKAVLLGVFVQ